MTLVAVLSLLACSDRSIQRPTSTPPPTPARVSFPSGHSVAVELAVTDEERARGLMFRESLARDRGVLFLFDYAAAYPFWMKNCRFPIDIVWLDDERRFVSAVYSVPPCHSESCPHYPPAGPALFVLEVGAGVAEAEQLQIGQRFTFHDLPVAVIPEGARAAALAP